jgi:hypothetical protein
MSLLLRSLINGGVHLLKVGEAFGLVVQGGKLGRQNRAACSLCSMETKAKR